MCVCGTFLFAGHFFFLYVFCHWLFQYLTFLNTFIFMNIFVFCFFLFHSCDIVLYKFSILELGIIRICPSYQQIYLFKVFICFSILNKSPELSFIFEIKSKIYRNICNKKKTKSNFFFNSIFILWFR